MRRRKGILFVSVVVIIIISAIEVREFFREPTALEWAARDSHIVLPEGIKVTRFRNEASGLANQDAWREIEF